jgi:curved DNA-binding protein CbpA
MTTSSDPEAMGGSTQRRRGATPNLASTDPYAVLGLLRGASAREIKRAYFDLVREYPPEEHPDTFKVIRAAYERLRQPDVKAETDLFLFQPPSPWEPRGRMRKLDLDVHAEDIALLLQQHGDLGQTDFRMDYRQVRL